MADAADHQTIIDAEHLKLLTWGYYISAGMAALFSLLGLFYMVLGVAMGAFISKVAAASGKPDQLPADFPVWFFGIFGLGFFLFMATAALLKFIVARKLRRQKSKGFCLVIAAISCLEFPYGTALGVCTFIVLTRPSVERMFEAPGR